MKKMISGLLLGGSLLIGTAAFAQTQPKKPAPEKAEKEKKSCSCCKKVQSSSAEQK